MTNKRPDTVERMQALDGSEAGNEGVALRRPRPRNKQPHDSRIPNEASLEALEQTRTGKGLISYDSFEDMMDDLFGDE